MAPPLGAVIEGGVKEKEKDTLPRWRWLGRGEAQDIINNPLRGEMDDIAPILAWVPPKNLFFWARAAARQDGQAAAGKKKIKKK